MSIEIKFEYGFESVNGIVKKKYYLHEIPFIREKCDVWNVLPLVYVRRFIGQKTGNNQEVYEGDIVKVGGLIEVVSYIDGILCCYSEVIYGSHDKVDIDYFESLTVTCSDYFEPYKVIGNIYENPELLNKKP